MRKMSSEWYRGKKSNEVFFNDGYSNLMTQITVGNLVTENNRIFTLPMKK